MPAGLAQILGVGRDEKDGDVIVSKEREMKTGGGRGDGGGEGERSKKLGGYKRVGPKLKLNCWCQTEALYIIYAFRKH